MVDKSKKRKKRTITEQDASNLLSRYSAQTVLALLKEVSSASEDKIDWNDLVKNTSTGITCAREYHKLWRHLAYGETLIDPFDAIADPMDVDSDLEYEIEAFPPVGREAAIETSACVKVLSQVLTISAHPRDSSLQENRIVEGPLPISIPNVSEFPTASASGSQGTNIIIPVPIEIQPLSSSNGGEKKPKNTKSDIKRPSRRKKAWSAEEDVKLTASVQKYGEHNWACISRGDFENGRSSSELSSRWASLKKQKSSVKVGTSSQHSETQLAAAHRAMSIALNMPMGDNKTGGIRSLNHSQKASALAIDPHHSVRPGLLNTQLPTKMSSMNNLSSGPDSRVKAAAVAAGARIATSADASSLLEAARSQNIVHITTGVSNVMKPSSASSMTSQLPSNVHFIRNGLTKNPISANAVAKPIVSSRLAEAQQAQLGQPIKSSASIVQSNKVIAPVLNGASVATNASVSSVKISKNGEDNAVSTSTNETTKVAQGDLDSNLGDRTTSLPSQTDACKNQGYASGHALNENTREVKVSTSVADPVSETTNNLVASSSSKN